MKSGLWILIVVIAAGIIVGSILRGRIEPPVEQDDSRLLSEIERIEDP
jgi:hypothetical protein